MLLRSSEIKPLFYDLSFFLMATKIRLPRNETSGCGLPSLGPPSLGITPSGGRRRDKAVNTKFYSGGLPAITKHKSQSFHSQSITRSKDTSASLSLSRTISCASASSVASTRAVIAKRKQHTQFDRPQNVSPSLAPTST